MMPPARFITLTIINKYDIINMLNRLFGGKMRLLFNYSEKWLLSVNAFSIYKDCMYMPSYEKYIEKMKAFIFDPTLKVYCFKNHCEYVGILIIKVVDNRAEIIGMAVDEKRRCSGIGREMLKFVIEKENIKFITAQTDDNAVGFYEKCGFEIKKKAVRYPDGDVIRYNCQMKIN